MSKMDRLYGVTMPEKGSANLWLLTYKRLKVWWHEMFDDKFKTRLKIAKTI